MLSRSESANRGPPDESQEPTGWNDAYAGATVGSDRRGGPWRPPQSCVEPWHTPCSAPNCAIEAHEIAPNQVNVRGGTNRSVGQWKVGTMNFYTRHDHSLTSEYFCGRCAHPVGASDRRCRGCRFDFNGSGRFQRFEGAPPTSVSAVSTNMAQASDHLAA